MRRVAALMVAILPVISKKMILVLMPYRNSARRIGSDKQQSNKGLPHKVFGSLSWANILKTCVSITTYSQYAGRLFTTARAQLLNTYSYVETTHIVALIQAKKCLLGVGLTNKISLSWVGRGPT